MAKRRENTLFCQFKEKVKNVKKTLHFFTEVW